MRNMALSLNFTPHKSSPACLQLFACRPGVVNKIHPIKLSTMLVYSRACFISSTKFNRC